MKLQDMKETLKAKITECEEKLTAVEILEEWLEENQSSDIDFSTFDNSAKAKMSSNNGGTTRSGKYHGAKRVLMPKHEFRGMTLRDGIKTVMGTRGMGLNEIVTRMYALRGANQARARSSVAACLSSYKNMFQHDGRGVWSVR